jgi:hypothetical protein
MADQLLTGVDFVAVPTHDLDTACAFYGETLRLPRRTYLPERGGSPSSRRAISRSAS